ncbi:hypothetical protein T492DRAFT_901875 [Pavlovales sp. CCMP2436]|nr:hypothetical protein T492DRAFT_901875 [Pavlovales sp. CCMP2436]
MAARSDYDGLTVRSGLRRAQLGQFRRSSAAASITWRRALLLLLAASATGVRPPRALARARGSAIASSCMSAAPEASGVADLAEQPTLLVVDDDATLRSAIVSYLRSHGFVVREAASADSALALASSKEPAHTHPHLR